jgi:hypothetical protein
MISAFGNRGSKNVRVGAVVISKLKLRNAQRPVFGADFVRNGLGDDRDDGIASHLV